MHVVEEEDTSKDQSKKDLLHSYFSHNKVDLVVKDKVYVDEG